MLQIIYCYRNNTITHNSRKHFYFNISCRMDIIELRNRLQMSLIGNDNWKKRDFCRKTQMFILTWRLRCVECLAYPPIHPRDRPTPNSFNAISFNTSFGEDLP